MQQIDRNGDLKDASKILVVASIFGWLQSFLAISEIRAKSVQRSVGCGSW